MSKFGGTFNFITVNCPYLYSVYFMTSSAPHKHSGTVLNTECTH